ncbi:hypothetical protein [Stutzerimonas balearica]|uniref:MFS transporter n=2 Tax=Stutzerimonas balearica DSM 6083 TaxID=1123016 RepID=A0A8D3XZN5_9GAMM|nr:hypothetical protein [Stutzerimonas balearica]WIX04787.1 DUF4149 domain-containing protein [Pseudomonas sp. AR5]HCW95387.1 DUF4149 domain-containing protein [Pseudomonas sp.]AJE14324.1 MFS transporter [Stutzerimonas balearica DSM 6083]MBD3734879.1 DUF4149 domain-containing protein [Stutzerimonas balearica]MBK3747177.1 DUF4149 domain-containing protein [Stutzerimonas balearica]
MRAAAMSWRLAQTFWVGGLWMLHFVLLPALARMGWAPLLVDDVADVLRPLLVGFAAFCVALQAMVLVQLNGLRRFVRDLRGQLLLLAWCAAALFFAVRHFLPQASAFWVTFGYLAMAVIGVLLVLQPAPRAGE